MNQNRIIASRIVGEELHERFAQLSGDRNPMHMDPVAARRTQAGLPVVHGVHTLLWALEELAAASVLSVSLASVQVRFLKWVYLQDEATLRFSPAEEGAPAVLTVEVQGSPVLTAIVHAADPASSVPAFSDDQPPVPRRPSAADLGFAEVQGRAGQVFVASAETVLSMFPHLTELLGAAAVAETAACSYVVGMEAPGLHSMFSRLDLSFASNLGPQSRGSLHFAVTGLDERFRKLRVALAGRAVRGNLQAFLRVPPVRQASLESIGGQVREGEFSGWKALVVGGSRGLGELTAKLIAAGGGVPTITYVLGRVEAEGVAEEIVRFGGQAEILAYDVRQAPAAQLANVKTAFTHVFYFATNTIARPKHALVTPHVLADFLTFYVLGFHDLCVFLTQPGRAARPEGKPLIAYYPSSIFIEERPEGMTEYAMAKAAGEQMCVDLNQYHPGLHVIASRLPRLPTDQTAGVLPGRDLEPVDVLLPLLRQMQVG